MTDPTPSSNAALVIGGGSLADKETASRPAASLVDSIFGKAKSSRRHGQDDNKKKKRSKESSSSSSSTGATNHVSDPSEQIRLASLFGEEVAQELRDAELERKELNHHHQQQQQQQEAAKAATKLSRRTSRKDDDASDDDNNASSPEGDDDASAADSASASSSHSKQESSPKKRKKDRKPPKGNENAATEEGEGDAKSNDNKDDAHDDNDAEDRTVFVGNLPLGTTRKTLEALFRGNGVCVDPSVDQVVSARIRRVPTQGVKLPPQHAGNQGLVQKVAANTGLFDPTKSSTCVGYVVFAHPSTVERALELNNMEIPDPTAEQHGQSKTRHIRVDRVRPVHDASRSVFVGNLPHNRTDEETLRQHVIKTCSLHASNDDDEDDPIEAVRVVRDGEFQCRGFAYVLLRDKSLVPHVLQQLSDSTYQGRQLRVQVCGKRFKNRRGEPKPAPPPEAALSPYSKVGRDKKRHRHGDLVTAAAAASAASASPMGALRRIMAAQASETKSKSRRARGPTMASKRAAGPSNKSPHKVPKRAAASSSANVKSAGSKRSASEMKTHDRAKKIEKRMSRGMGKNKKSAGR